MPAERVEKWVIEQINDFLRDFSDQTAERILDEIKNRSSNFDSEKNRLREIELKLKNATDAILNGITYPELMEEIKSLRKERAELETTIARASSEKVPITKEEIMNAFLERIDNEKIDYRQLMRKFVISIKVNERQIKLSLGVVHFASSGNWI